MGQENYPLLLGHESAGRVVETGGKVTSFRIGDRAIGGLLLDPPGNTYGSGWVGDLKVNGNPVSNPELINTIGVGRVNHLYSAPYGHLNGE